MPKATYGYAISFDAGGNVENAIIYYTEALRLADLSADTALLARILISFGNLRIKIEDYKLGQRNLQDGLSLAQHLQDSMLVGIGLHNLSKAHFLSGDFSSALETLRIAQDYVREFNSQQFEAALLTTMSQVYFDLGAMDSAELVLRKAISIVESENAKELYLEYVTNLLYHYVNTEEFEKLFQLLQKEYQTMNSNGWTHTGVSLEARNYVHQEAEAFMIQQQTILKETTTTAHQRFVVALGLFAFLCVAGGWGWRMRLKYLATEAKLDSQSEARARALKRFHEVTTLMDKKDKPLLVVTYVLMTLGFSFIQIGRHIGKDSTTTGRYAREIAEQLGMEKEAMMQEARKLGRFIWPEPLLPKGQG